MNRAKSVELPDHQVGVTIDFSFQDDNDQQKQEPNSSNQGKNKTEKCYSSRSFP